MLTQIHFGKLRFVRSIKSKTVILSRGVIWFSTLAFPTEVKLIAGAEQERTDFLMLEESFERARFRGLGRLVCIGADLYAAHYDGVSKFNMTTRRVSTVHVSEDSDAA